MTSNTSKFLGILILIVVIGAFVFTTCTASVPTGYTGIVTTFGRVEDKTLDAGFHFKTPVQKVVMMDNREQKTTFSAQAFSSDIQQVEVFGSINYSIDPRQAQTLYKEVGVNYFNTLMMNRLIEHTKAVFARYTAENLISARDELSVSIRSAMSAEMSGYGINIINISVENIDFTDKFTEAVEQKQVAAQKKLQAEIEQDQKTMETQQQAERERIIAEAAANVKKINAEADATAVKLKAEAEAEANNKIAASLTPELIEWLHVNQWDGKMPTYYAGEGNTTMPILNMGAQPAVTQ